MMKVYTVDPKLIIIHGLVCIHINVLIVLSVFSSCDKVRLWFAAMTALTASICWNILAHKTEEASEMGVRIYQKPESNDIYGLRRRKNPPLCKENENPDAAW